MVAEDVLDRPRLGGVAERRRRAVRVDVADLLRLDAGALRAPRASSPPRRPSRDPAAPCGARRSRRRSRAPPRRCPHLVRGPNRGLPEQDAGALAHHEAGARRVERARRVRRMLLLRGEPAHRAEAREDQRMDARLGAAGEHRVGVAALDQLRRLTDRVRAGRARGDDGVVRPADPELDRDLAARRVDEDVRQEVRRDPVRPRSRRTSVCSAIPTTPPIAEPRTMPTRVGSKPFSPASSTASFAAATASSTLRSSRRASFGDTTPAASKSFTSAATRTGTGSRRTRGSSRSRSSPRRRRATSTARRCRAA